MGEVFLADDTRLGRKVALKSLSAAGDAHPEETRRKLLREARAAAKLNHPNIAAVYDVIESGEEAQSESGSDTGTASTGDALTSTS